MIEQEAIKYIENHGYIADDVKDIAIKALETMQELKKRNLTIADLENYMQFEDECVKKGFSFSSLLEAREKQIPKKPIPDTQPEIGKFIRWECPGCRDKRWIGFFFPPLTFDKVCTKCMQAIDWKFEVKRNDD